ncbi:YabP/YqfC family sporulation protein [Clostridium perfringens]|uniref:YabP/YqfC family sporulation protein n=1 Tax=Clostridium perfringens TaxID=1502 RepID=UPI003754E9D6
MENYKSILEYDVNLIKIKTKLNTIKICGEKLYLKHITETEIGIKGIIYSVEYTT